MILPTQWFLIKHKASYQLLWRTLRSKVLSHSFSSCRFSGSLSFLQEPLVFLSESQYLPQERRTNCPPREWLFATLLRLFDTPPPPPNSASFVSFRPLNHVEGRTDIKQTNSGTTTQVCKDSKAVVKGLTNPDPFNETDPIPSNPPTQDIPN